MPCRRFLFLLPAIAVCMLGTGCQWVPKSQFTACEIRNRELVARNKALLSERQNLQTHNRELAGEIVQTEEDLAVLQQQLGVNGRRDTFRREFAGSAGQPSRYTRLLSGLSERFPDLRFDAENGVCKLDSDVLFDTGQSRLKPESRQLLEDFAHRLNTPQTRPLRIMVVGHTDDRAVAGRDVRTRFPNNWHLSSARALAVADLLQHHGVGGDRLGVAGFGRHQPLSDNDSAGQRQQNRRVEIFVMAPDVPVVGWADTMTGLY